MVSPCNTEPKDIFEETEKLQSEGKIRTPEEQHLEEQQSEETNISNTPEDNPVTICHDSGIAQRSLVAYLVILKHVTCASSALSIFTISFLPLLSTFPMAVP